MISQEYSPQMKNILLYTHEEAIRLGNDWFETDHLFLGLLREGSSIAIEILLQLGIDLHNMRKNIETDLKKDEVLGIERQKDLHVKSNAERVLKLVWLEAKNLASPVIHAEHLLLAIMRDETSRVYKALNADGVTYNSIKSRLNDIRKNDMMATINDILEFSQQNRQEEDEEDEDFGQDTTRHLNSQNSNSNTPILDSFGVDLTKAAADNLLDPIVGREIEMERLLQILSRRKKNNPVLIGEPGVGKSAIVEGLAIKIVKRQVSSMLFNKRIITLDMAAMVAGTKYRGQFEERIKNMIDELSRNPHIILFIDEIHTIIGAGGASGSLDAANILKPALARGTIQCIGATTLDEYRQYIEKDGALERRFQKVLVEPASSEETLNILKNIKSRYEDHHNVTYTDKALEACVKLSMRYISDRCLPDKAIDVMDEAGSRIHVFTAPLPEKIIEIEKEIEITKESKLKASAEDDFEKAIKYRNVERDLLKAIETEKKEWNTQLVKNREIVNEETIAHVIAMMTGVPVKRVTQAEGQRLLGMVDALNCRVIGQAEAISKITKSIQRNRAGLKDPNKPIGTFVFLGPTGVGKTQLAKVLAEYLFDTAESLIRIDMSEFVEKFAVSRLVGAPPGYVGYEEGGQLTEKIRRKPHSVVLLDEIEKAHPDVFHILLQVLDEGQLTDSFGRRIDFRNTLIIMTSNIGSTQLKDFGAGVGFMTSAKENSLKEHAKYVVEKAMKRTFAPEFINRIDDIVVFNSLTKEDIAKIIDIELEGIKKRVEDMKLNLSISDTAKNFIADKGFDQNYGARPLKRALQQYLEDEMTDAILKEEIRESDVIHVDYNSEVDAEKVCIVIKKHKRRKKK